jgi:hypothetical protein
MSIFLQWLGAANPNLVKNPDKEPDDQNNKFLRSIESLRNMFQDLYSGEAFHVLHEFMKDHYQPR